MDGDKQMKRLQDGSPGERELAAKSETMSRSPEPTRYKERINSSETSSDLHTHTYIFKKVNRSLAWWLMPGIPALRRLKRLKDSLVSRDLVSLSMGTYL